MTDSLPPAAPWGLLVGGTSVAIVLALLLSSLRGLCRSPWEALALLTRLLATICTTLGRFVARGCQPRFPKWTLRFELLRALIREATDLYGDRMISDVSCARVIRQQSEAVGSVLGWVYCYWYSRRLEAVQLNGLEHLWLRPSTSQPLGTKRLVLLYIHGGAFAILTPRFYAFFGATLAAAIDQQLGGQARALRVEVEVFLANYRKTPEFSFPTQPEDAVAAYEYLLRHEKIAPNQIILAGDSAGGGLVMSTLLRVRDGKAKLPLPLAAIVLSPFVDLTEGKDPASGQHCVLSRSIAKAARLAYHPTCNDRTTWMDASSVQCDLRGLPPVFIQAAGLDYLYQHSLRLAAKAKADGVANWELDVHDGVPHVFALFPTFVLPYSHVGVQKIAAFAAHQFLKT